jgi:hypothetical protein
MNNESPMRNSSYNPDGKLNYRKAAKNLRDAVSHNSHMSAAELREKLTEEGVNVDQFLDLVDVALGTRKNKREPLNEPNPATDTADDG